MGKTQAACAGQLVFIPSYFDYVRVRALAKAAGAEFAALSEYAQVRLSVCGGGQHFHCATVQLRVHTNECGWQRRVMNAIQAETHVCMLHVRAAAGGGPRAVNVCGRAAAAGADDRACPLLPAHPHARRQGSPFDRPNFWRVRL